MKEFFWQYFSRCGNLDAYLLYKESEQSGIEPVELAEMTVQELETGDRETLQ
ncbi:YqzL family protein [Gorillibacterium massiliense]|uniref:YqzL family protein n=1 Tax=Gorillibacterium massiliense TaxID=1280390 RepID=UPI0012DF2B09|nr:YqzL family protein [Gorillibacterium massiliense]